MEATQPKNKINHLDQSKIDIDSLFCYKRKHKKFIRNNKLILKTQQKFKTEIHNVFTEKINKIALSSNDDKRRQSIDSIETYGYGTSKDLVSEKEEIKCNNKIKWCKKWLTLMLLQKKTQKSIIQLGHKLLIIHTEYK